MNRLKELRQAASWKQADLAARLGVKQQAISKYETGVLDLDTDTIRRLCAIFACSADYLLGLSSRRSPGISEEDARLLAAYHAASDRDRGLVDGILADYIEKKETAAG